MFSSIPIAYYTPFFYYVVLFVILITFIHTRGSRMGSPANKSFQLFVGTVLLFFVWFYMGFRPVNGPFGDMYLYNHTFELYVAGIDTGNIIGKSDLLFQSFTKFCAHTMSADAYFFICAAVYVLPLYFACRKWFKRYWFYAFLGLVASFSFWPYGTNGIRNGMATSLALLALSRNKKLWVFAIFIVAINIHKTMTLPLIGYILSLVVKNSKPYFIFWLLCIPVSLILGGTMSAVMGSFVEDSRAAYFTSQEAAGVFSSTGFRWDFLLYGAAPIIVGLYYTYKKPLNDAVYRRLFNVYLFANAFWILVIRANFSNRFAYLSWFMMAVVILYPFIKGDMSQKTHKNIGLILLCYYAFTFLMGMILQK